MQNHVKKWGHEKVVTNHCRSGCSRPLLCLHNHEGALGTGLGLAHHSAQINHCTEPSKPCNHPACTFWKILGLLLLLGRSFTHSQSFSRWRFVTASLPPGSCSSAQLMTGRHSLGFSLQMKPGSSPYSVMSPSVYAFYDQGCGLWWVSECGRALEAPHANEEGAGSGSSCLRGNVCPHTFHIPAKVNLSWQL